jgi:hypothetical protein
LLTSFAARLINATNGIGRHVDRLPSLNPQQIERIQDSMSKNFERWKELAILTSKEQDPAKLTKLANEMNLVLTQKTLHLDPPLHAPSPAAGSHEESQLDDVLQANAGGKVCFT